MKTGARKAVVRKLRKMMNRHFGNMVDEKFEMGCLAASLFPDWVESDYSTFDLYLFHGCGIPWNIASRLETMAHTYYEIPSLQIWMQVGYTRAAQAAGQGREGQIRALLESGSNVLDVLTLI